MTTQWIITRGGVNSRHTACTTFIIKLLQLSHLLNCFFSIRVIILFGFPEQWLLSWRLGSFPSSDWATNHISAAFLLLFADAQRPLRVVLWQDDPQPSEELPVLLKLQRKVKELEQNKQSLWERLDEKEGTRQVKARVKHQYGYQIWLLYLFASCVFLLIICVCSPKKGVGWADKCWQSWTGLGTTEGTTDEVSPTSPFGLFSVLACSFSTQRHDLESDNKKLKQDLNDLRKSLSSENSHLMPPAPGSLPYSILLDQLNSSNDELEMRKEEVLLLQSHMVRQDARKHRVGWPTLYSSS